MTIKQTPEQQRERERLEELERRRLAKQARAEADEREWRELNKRQFLDKMKRGKEIAAARRRHPSARIILATLALGAGLAIAVPAVEKAEAKTPAAWCRDGWRSRSSGRGTCSWHGGCVKTWTWRGYRCI